MELTRKAIIPYANASYESSRSIDWTEGASTQILTTLKHLNTQKIHCDQTSIQLVPRALSPKLKWPGREANHLPSSWRALAKNG
jgi:hypothetical protein